MTSNYCISETVSIAAGDATTCAVLIDNSVYCWGKNYNGQLGTGDTAWSYIPAQVTGLVPGYTSYFIKDRQAQRQTVRESNGHSNRQTDSYKSRKFYILASEL